MGTNGLMTSPGSPLGSLVSEQAPPETPCRRRRSRSSRAALPCVSGVNFHSLVHRYYDPATEQFLSVDPLVDQTGTPYAFTNGDPVNEMDPTGLGFSLGNFIEGVDFGLEAFGAAALGGFVFSISVAAEPFSLGLSSVGVASAIAIETGAGALGYASYYSFKEAFMGKTKQRSQRTRARELAVFLGSPTC